MVCDGRNIAARFDVQAQQRLGVRAAQIEAPVGEFDADAVGAIHCGNLPHPNPSPEGRGASLVLQDAFDGFLHVIHAVVDLAAARIRFDALTHSCDKRLPLRLNSSVTSSRGIMPLSQ